MGKPGKIRGAFRLLRRAIRSACLMALAYWIGYFLIMGNLWGYSVYYANNMPHKEGSDPVLALLMYNLEWIELPEVDGIEYDFDGLNLIKNKNLEANGNIPRISSGYPYDYADVNGIVYYFDESFRLDHVTDWNLFRAGKPYEIDKVTVDLEKVKKEIYELVDPVIKNKNREPFFNLQWIFNWYYYDRFN